ncbi:hypothetical protein D9M71_526030 [compost metagenome]
MKSSIRATGLMPDSGSEECAETPVTVSKTCLPSALASMLKSLPCCFTYLAPACCRCLTSCAGLSEIRVATEVVGIWLVARPPVRLTISAPLPLAGRLVKLAMTVP